MFRLTITCFLTGLHPWQCVVSVPPTGEACHHCVVVLVWPIHVLLLPVMWCVDVVYSSCHWGHYHLLMMMSHLRSVPSVRNIIVMLTGRLDVVGWHVEEGVCYPWKVCKSSPSLTCTCTRTHATHTLHTHIHTHTCTHVHKNPTYACTHAHKHTHTHTHTLHTYYTRHTHIHYIHTHTHR